MSNPVSYYIRSDEIWSQFGTASLSAGTEDSDYPIAQAVDAIPGLPMKTTGTAATIQILNSAGIEVGAVIIGNHKLDPGLSSTIGGGTVSGSIVVPAVRANRIPLNPWKAVGPSSAVTTLTLAITGNSVNIVIGEIIAGKLRQFPGNGLLVNGTSFNPKDWRLSGAGPKVSSIMGYDPAVASRVFTSSCMCTESQADDLMQTFEAQRNGSRFTVLIPNSTINDAWIVDMMEPKFAAQKTNTQRWLASLTFNEYPRTRW